MKTLHGKLNIEFKCYWHDIKCKRVMECDDCDLQPPDDEKPNGKAEPLALDWMTDWEGFRFPICPRCHNFADNENCCKFCGQKYLLDKKATKFFALPEVETMDCFHCKTKDAIQFVRAYNGHRHGFCTACGLRFME